MQEVIRDTIRAEHFRGKADRRPGSPMREMPDHLVGAPA
jgi:hypothetical protein